MSPRDPGAVVVILAFCLLWLAIAYLGAAAL